LLLRANVDSDANRFDYFALLILQASAAHDDPAYFPVRQKKPVFALELSVDRASAVVFRFYFLSFVRVDARKDRLAGQRSASFETINRAALLAHPRGVVFRIQTPERKISRLRGQTDARFALAQDFLLSLAFNRDSGDVGGDTRETFFFRMWTAFFFAIHRERTKHVTLRGDDRCRPARAES